jgi:hypothetical protein
LPLFRKPQTSIAGARAARSPQAHWHPESSDWFSFAQLFKVAPGAIELTSMLFTA